MAETANQQDPSGEIGVGAPASEDISAAAPTLLQAPASGAVLALTVEAGGAYAIDPAAQGIGLEMTWRGDDLVLAFSGAGSIELRGAARLVEADAPPLVILPDGTVLGVDRLFAMLDTAAEGAPLETAAGPDAVAVGIEPGEGFHGYSDYQGEAAVAGLAPTGTLGRGSFSDPPSFDPPDSPDLGADTSAIAAASEFGDSGSEESGSEDGDSEDGGSEGDDSEDDESEDSVFEDDGSEDDDSEDDDSEGDDFEDDESEDSVFEDDDSEDDDSEDDDSEEDDSEDDESEDSVFEDDDSEDDDSEDDDSEGDDFEDDEFEDKDSEDDEFEDDDVEEGDSEDDDSEVGDSEVGDSEVDDSEDGDDSPGRSGDDEVTGGEGDDRLIGGANDDTLDGAGGDDNLKGGAGDDTLMGGLGDDKLNGGAGDDTLDGGGGDDELQGGLGADVFVFDFGDGGDGFGTDTVKDFNPGQGDVLSFINVMDDDSDSSGADLNDLLGTISDFQDNGRDVTIDFGESGTVVLKGIGTGAMESFGDLLSEIGQASVEVA